MNPFTRLSETTPSAAHAPAHRLLGLAALLRQHFAGADLSALGERLLALGAEGGAGANEALLDAALILQFKGNKPLALTVQRMALETQRHFVLPARRPARLKLLVLLAAGDMQANAPLECLLEDADIDLHLWYLLPGDSPLRPFSPLPEHDLVFVALSETVANRPLIEQLCVELAKWPMPVVNTPHHLHRLARDSACYLLNNAPGVLIPPTLRAAKSALENADWATMQEDFPLIVRPLDSHAGDDLQRVDTPAALLDYLAQIHADEFFIAPFVDYRSADGQFRKYRVVLINGRPYAVHMAISNDWMIHYLNAGMLDDPAKRAEEADWMERFDADFAQRHATALNALHERVGLDYLGIDCAQTREGALLIFEIDHAMVVHALDSAALFPYKQPQMRRVFAAFVAMLEERAQRAQTGMSAQLQPV